MTPEDRYLCAELGELNDAAAERAINRIKALSAEVEQLKKNYDSLAKIHKGYDEVLDILGAPVDSTEWLMAWANGLKAERDALQAQVDGAYLERNQVVAALAKCFPSAVTKTAIEGWDPAWHNCVYIQLPTGQASWHFHDREANLFEKIQKVDSHKWDGHTTEEKYKRVAALAQAGSGEMAQKLGLATDTKIATVSRAYDVDETVGGQPMKPGLLRSDAKPAAQNGGAQS